MSRPCSLCVNNMKVLLCVVGLLLASFGLVTGSVKWAELSKSDHSRLVAKEPRHRAVSEIVEEVRKRRAASSSPNDTSKFTFTDDSHNSGIIQYSGGDSKVIFVLTYTVARNAQNQRRTVSSYLYRSIDYGRTFTNITSQVSSGSHILYQSIHVAPNNNKILIFRDAYHAQIYITKDEGNTFTTQPLSPSTVDPQTILFHPTLYTNFLIYDSDNYALYVTNDLGITLTKLSDHILPRQYQWGVGPYDKDPTTVYYNVFDPTDVNRGDYTVPLYTKTAPYTNQPVEFDPNIGKHDDFLIVGRYMFIQKTSSGLATLWVSYDRKPFRMAHIPSTIPHQNYIVDDIKSLQALVIVQHTNGHFNLYLSEETGQYFTLSLPDLVVAYDGLDLELVDSMNATYIANQNIGSNVRTLISFDNGGNWQLLRPPATALTCEPPSCSLHLHMSSSQYWRTGVYSQSSAPGIIIAHGTTGSSLSSNPDLYVSNDGGINWILALQSSWGVAVLDHGGLIVAAKDYYQGNRSSVLMYSCDEGASWTPFTFSNTDIVIFGVITEPGATSTVVSLYGIEEFANPEWTVIKIDFKAVFTGHCQSTDYYWWHPWDERSSNGCLLGSRVSIQRRKPSVCCLNSQQFSRVVNYTKCDCNFEDFECDYGYMHSNGVNSICVRDTMIALPCYCVIHDTLSKGYRKVGGDVCEGGSEYQYEVTDPAPWCSNKSTDLPTPPTCPPCSSSNTPTSFTHVTGSIAGPATSSTNVVAVVLAVLLVIAVVIIIALFTVSVVLAWKLMAKAGGGSGYQVVPRNERFVFRSHSPDGVQTNFNDDDDDAPLQP